MDLTIYNVIQGPVITDKASKLITVLNKVILKVHPHANKPMIKEALEKLFDVKVKDIRIIVRKGKTRTFKRVKTTGKTEKRAIVTLKPGYSLDMIGTTPSVESVVAEETAVK